MWVRLTAILLCIVFFITGCNSLVSQFFGTHKLRHFEMNQVLSTGIADSDYISIEAAWQTGDYIVVPPKNESDKAILIYPILSEEQVRKVEKGERVKPRIIAWSKQKSIDCDEAKACAPKGEVLVKGVVRRMRNQKNKAHMLPEDRYELPDNVDYVEVGRAPIAWYWNVLMLLGGLGFAFYIESRAHKQKQEDETM